MKKNRILTYIILFLPILITIGFSSWIIVYTFEFEPTYKASPVSSLYDFSQTVIYNAEEQVPKPKDGVTITGNISYEYKLEKDTIYKSGKPINAGSYDVKITISNSDINGTCQVKFIINKKRINFTNQTISIAHGDGKCEPYWQSVQKYVKSQISFVDEKNAAVSSTEIMPSDINFEGMHNGVFSYGKVEVSVTDKTSSDMIGSTYVASITLNEQIADNYEFINGNQIYIKYKTVNLNGSLFTIEDAILAGSGDMTLVGGKIGDMINTYVKTCFSLVLNTKNYTISNRQLKVPYNSSGTTLTQKYEEGISEVYSVLYIPKGIRITLESNSSIVVCGYMYQGGQIQNRGVVMNHGDIYLKSSKYYSYGFTKGTGYMELDSNSEAVDVFMIYDWPGADEAINLKDGKAFPVKEWSVHNIACTIKFSHNALYNSVSFVAVLNGWITIPIDGLYIVGKTNTSKCLFRPTGSSSSSDYIIKTATIPNDTITESNQKYGQKDKIEIYGDYEDSNVEISVSGYGSFATSTSIAIPISYFDITVTEGTLNLTNSSYIFQNNTSKLIIESEAILKIDGDAYVAFLNDSVLTLRGTLKGTGTFGGIIDTDVTNAVVEIKNFYKDGIVLKTGPTTFDDKIESTAIGYIWQNNEISAEHVAFNNSYIYISKKIGSKYYFEGSLNYNLYTINYYLNGNYNNGLEEIDEEIVTETFPSFDETYIIGSNNLISREKTFYVIEGWYTDTSFSKESKFSSATLTKSDSSLTLYAKWIEKKFSFIYIVEYEDSATCERVNINIDASISNQMKSITKSSFNNGDIAINTTVTYLDKYFNGWYIGNTDNEQLKIGFSLSYEYFNSYVEQSGYDTIYLYCLFKDFVTYTVVYENVMTEVTGADTIQIQSNENLTLPNTSVYNSKNTILNYYAYWSFASYTDTISDFENNDPTYVINGIKISALISQIETYNNTQTDSAKKINLIDNKIVIYGKMKEKDYKVTDLRVDLYDSQIEQVTYYYNSGGVHTIPTGDSLKKDGFVYKEIDITGGTAGENNTLIIHENATIKIKYYKIITVSVTIKGFTDGVGSASVTIDKIYDSTTGIGGSITVTSSSTITTIQGAKITQIYAKTTFIGGTASISYQIGSSTTQSLESPSGRNQSKTHNISVEITADSNVSII